MTKKEQENMEKYGNPLGVKRGDLIIVHGDYKRVFSGYYIKGAEKPWACVMSGEEGLFERNELFNIFCWKTAERIPEKKTRNMTALEIAQLCNVQCVHKGNTLPTTIMKIEKNRIYANGAMSLNDFCENWLQWPSRNPYKVKIEDNG